MRGLTLPGRRVAQLEVVVLLLLRGVVLAVLGGLLLVVLGRVCRPGGSRLRWILRVAASGRLLVLVLVVLAVMWRVRGVCLARLRALAVELLVLRFLGARRTRGVR